MLVGSTIFSKMSGKLNGAVAMDGRAGLALRAHVIPANPKSTAQQQVRLALRQVTALFYSSAVSPAQRTAWTLYAAGESLKGKLGGSFKPTAGQAFVAVNAVRVQLGLNPVLVPPPAGRHVADVSVAWSDETLMLSYPVPAAGVPDALALGGAVKVFAARRPIFQHRRYGPWDVSLTVSGAASRPTGTFLETPVGENAEGYQLFYRIIGSVPSGQPLAVVEGVADAG